MSVCELPHQDVDAIEEIHDRWIREERAGNNSGVIELCTDDARWMPPDSRPIVGKEAIARYLSASTAELEDVQVGDVVISGSGRTAYLTSSYRSRFRVKGVPDLQEATGAHLWILRKTEGGGWRVAVVAWNAWGG